MINSNISLAFLSTWDKTQEQLALAKLMAEKGAKIVSSGGTKEKFLEPAGVEVTDCADITKYPAVLGHKVVTIHPRIAGGLLSFDSDDEEMKKLEWDRWDFLLCTFYPLEETMNDPDKTAKQINDMVDIGGPTMVRAALKGGKRWIIVDNNDVAWFTELYSQNLLKNHHLEWLKAKAVTTVALYCAQESIFRTRVTFGAMETENIHLGNASLLLGTSAERLYEALDQINKARP